MTNRLCLSMLLAAVLLAALSLPAPAAGPDPIEIRAGAGSLGRLARIVVDDGTAYVAADRLATLVKGSWSATGSRGTLAVGARTAQFARNDALVVIQAKPVMLDAPARGGATGWLIPEDFLVKGLPKLAPGVVAVLAEPKTRATRTTGEVALTELRYRTYPSYTRVVVETAVAIRAQAASGPLEIRVTLPRLGPGSARNEEVGDGLVKGISLEPGDGDALLRIALEAVAGDVKTSVLQDPPRLVIDVYRSRVTPPVAAAPAVARGTVAPLRLIVLDAGHGGHDTGAIGPSGTTEKDIVLDVTKRVARLLEDETGVKVALTRGTDVFVPLRDRTTFANKQRADLFVSIHANAHPRATSEGVETYFLSSEASDSDARQVAALENGVIRLESPATRAKGDLLKNILWGLAQSEFQQESSFVAETVQDSMTRSLGLVNRGVKQAGFYVLNGATMPAILIEIGFITNPREERKLGTAAYRESVARAIHAGISDYKRRYEQRLGPVALPAGSPR